MSNAPILFARYVNQICGIGARGLTSLRATLDISASACGSKHAWRVHDEHRLAVLVSPHTYLKSRVTICMCLIWINRFIDQLETLETLKQTIRAFGYPDLPAAKTTSHSRCWWNQKHSHLDVIGETRRGAAKSLTKCFLKMNWSGIDASRKKQKVGI